MSKRINYSKGLAEEMGCQGVALVESGAYVHRSIDEDELARVAEAARQKREWEAEPKLVVVKGRGCLVRPGLPSKDGQFIKFLGKIVSLKLIQGEVLSHRELAKRLDGLPGAKILDVNKGSMRVGILFGSLEDPYAVLVDVLDGKLRFHDVETKERANNRHVLVKILPLDERDRIRLEEIRKTIAGVAATNTQAK